MECKETLATMLLDIATYSTIVCFLVAIFFITVIHMTKD